MAPEIGETLRRARLDRGIDLESVERAIKIRVRYLRAMEEDSWELLPAPAYARGFLRTYASFLGLDADALLRELGHRYEPAEATRPEPAPRAPPEPAGDGRRLRLSGWALAGLAAVAVIGVLVVLGVTGGSRNGGGEAGRGGSGPPGGPGPTTSTTPQAPAPTTSSVQLRATGTVWVCLVDDRGRALVDGLTMSAGEVRGPYRSQAFKVTFGNGAVQMEVGGKTVTIPQVAEPLGYEISPNGVRQLDPAQRPTCT